MNNGGLAYADDKHDVGDAWQLLDFMDKLKLSYHFVGLELSCNTYRRSNKAPKKPVADAAAAPAETNVEYRYVDANQWWKFWKRY